MAEDLKNDREEEMAKRKRKPPQLSAKERARRARVSGLVKWAGKKGFYGTLAEIKGKPEVREPKRLAGWMKAKAAERGQLSAAHPYTGRRKRGGAKYARLRAMAKRAG